MACGNIEITFGKILPTKNPVDVFVSQAERLGYELDYKQLYNLRAKLEEPVEPVHNTDVYKPLQDTDNPFGHLLEPDNLVREHKGIKYQFAYKNHYINAMDQSLTTYGNDLSRPMMKNSDLAYDTESGEFVKCRLANIYKLNDYIKYARCDFDGGMITKILYEGGDITVTCDGRYITATQREKITGGDFTPLVRKLMQFDTVEQKFIQTVDIDVDDMNTLFEFTK